MKIYKLCRALAMPMILLSLLVVLGIVGAIENGAELSLAWWAFGTIGVTWCVLLGASRDREGGR